MLASTSNRFFFDPGLVLEGFMNPCWFPDKTNPFTKQKCVETFSTINNKKNSIKLDKDNLIKSLCYGTSGIILLYILYKLFEKRK